jgi:hypothetical protein
MKSLYSIYTRLALIGAGCLLFTHCKKSSSNPQGTTGIHVYIAGSNGTNPVLWTNGSPQVLSASVGLAFQVVVSDSDVYVAGMEGGSQTLSFGGPGGYYAYWKNGQQSVITGVGPMADQSSIAIAGGNLYYANGSLWQNGLVYLQQGQGSAESSVVEVFGVGNDIYAVGSDSTDTPVYWKNGQRVVVAQRNPMLSYPFVECIYVTGSDVYVGGFDAGGRPAYWKNGVVTELLPADPGTYVSQARSIFVNGNDVYVVGNYYSPTTAPQPAYWKNGVQQDLPLNGATYGTANDIFVVDSTVYVAGQTSAGAVYWKNGVENLLAAAGEANSVVVQ